MMRKFAKAIDPFVRPAGAWMRVCMVVLPVVLLVSITVAAFFYLDRRETERITHQLNTIARQYADLLDRHIQVTLTILNTTAGFFAGSVEVSRAEFHEFVASASIQNFGIQAIGWVPRVLENERATYDAAARSDGLSDFTIHRERPVGKLVPTLKHEEYFPAFYLEPLSGNEALLGLDLNLNPAQHEALEHARDSGKLVATAPIQLGPELDKQTRFLIFQPMYAKGRTAVSTPEERRQYLTGFTVSIFRASDLVENALRGIAQRDIALRLVDTAAPQEENLLYENASFMAASINPEAAAMRWVTTLNVPGRIWQLDIVPTPEFFAAHQSLTGWIVLASGLLVAVLMQALTLLISGRSVRIEQLVTERTEKLRSKSALLEAQLNSTIDGILVVDNDGKKVIQNQRCVDLWNIPREIAESDDDKEQLHFVMSQVINPEAFTEKMIHLYSHPDEISRDEVELTDGTILDRYSSPVRDKDRKHYGRIWAFRDITERKQAEQRLTQAEARYRHLLNSSPSVIYATNSGPEHRCTFVSDTMALLTGYEPQAMMNDPGFWSAHVHPDDIKRTLSELQRQKIQGGGILEYRFRHKDGEYCWIRDTFRIIQDASGTPVEVIGSWTDITTKRRTEEQLAQSQKMEAIGQLTGGVAHDFNNRLTVIMGNLELLQRRTERDPAAMDLVKAALLSADGAASLTRELLTFSRQQVLESAMININELIKGMRDLLQRTLGETIKVVVSPEPELWPVMTDRNLLENVLLNLAVNARDAMPHGGKLILETSNRILDATYSETHGREIQGEYVLLAVSDTGTGMSEEVKRRAFEPFFTTKPTGKGTGLGLAMVYSFVKQSGGHIDIYSEPGRGTSFKLYFPKDVSAAVVAAPTQPIAGEEEAIIRDKTILLVEDEATVRNIVVSQLGNLGCRVLSADNGPAALEIFAKTPDIDLLFTDIIMPGGVTGLELAAKMRERMPELKVLYTSGYAPQAAADRRTIENPNDSWLAKPYRFKTLKNILIKVFGTQ